LLWRLSCGADQLSNACREELVPFRCAGPHERLTHRRGPQFHIRRKLLEGQVDLGPRVEPVPAVTLDWQASARRNDVRDQENAAQVVPENKRCYAALTASRLLDTPLIRVVGRLATPGGSNSFFELSQTNRHDFKRNPRFRAPVLVKTLFRVPSAQRRERSASRSRPVRVNPRRSLLRRAGILGRLEPW